MQLKMSYSHMYARAGVSVCLQNIHLIFKNMWVKKKEKRIMNTDKERENTVNVSLTGQCREDECSWHHSFLQVSE